MMENATRREILRAAAMVVATAACVGHAAFAEPYPARPVRLLVGGAAGSVPDVVARLLGQWLSGALRQPVIIEDRPGAGGIIAMQALAASPPDGYTIALATMSQAVFNSYLFSKLPYDPLRDLEPVSPVVTGGMAIAVNPAFAANTFAELMSFAKARPGKLLFGTAQNGSPPHVIAQLVIRAAGIDVTFVPFKSGSDAVTAVLRGDIPVAIDAPPIFAPLVREGTLKLLAVTGRSREEVLPQVPTVAEAGYPGVQGEAWIGVVAPAHTPPEIVMRLNHEIARILAVVELRDRFRTLSFAPMRGNPDEFRALLREEHARWGAIIRDAGIKLD